MPLLNFDHLNFLSASVRPPDQKSHTTWRLRVEPTVGVIWTYGEHGDGDTYVRTGGGAYHAAGDNYDQGAFNADDVARAAVVRVRHWVASGDQKSRDAAYQLLRGLAYFQTCDGPNAGYVVLWMQPDGCLNSSASPSDTPEPSDSGPSFWFARTIWAMGEGFRAFAAAGDAFADFLQARIELALAALSRERAVEDVGLIAERADLTAELLLGLIAYLDAEDSRRARFVMNRLVDGLAQVANVSADGWPSGLIPTMQSPMLWHAWGSRMATALSGTAQLLNRPELIEPAYRDAVLFTTQMMIDGGPHNCWSPERMDRTQIAYGADSRLEAVLAMATLTGHPGLHRLANIAAGWFFGLNASGESMYEPHTGRTFDGVSDDGEVNRNSGAESTTHGLLSMLKLDASPDSAVEAQSLRLLQRQTGKSGQPTVGFLLLEGSPGIVLLARNCTKLAQALFVEVRVPPVTQYCWNEFGLAPAQSAVLDGSFVVASVPGDGMTLATFAGTAQCTVQWRGAVAPEQGPGD